MVFPPNLHNLFPSTNGSIVINVFFLNAYCKYLSFATVGSLDACLGGKVFKFLWTIIFGRFFWQMMSRDENWSLLILRFSSDMKNAWWCRVALFVKYLFFFFSWYLSYLEPCHWHGLEYHYNMGKTIWQKVLFHIITHFIFHKSGSWTLTLAGAFICFITTPFSDYKKFLQISSTCGFPNIKLFG